jgi:hypothetical protein
MDMAEIAPIEVMPSVKSVEHVSLVQGRKGDCFLKQETVGHFAGLLFHHFRGNRR